MTFGFNELQSCLAEWPTELPLYAANDDLLINRIRQILVGSNYGGILEKADLQPLVRHLLLRESANTGHPQQLRVPVAI